MAAIHPARRVPERLVIVAIAAVAWVSGCGGDDSDSRADEQHNPESCGPAQCETGMVCCDHCAGTCVPEESGVQCPDDLDPGRDCDEDDTASACPDEPPSEGEDCPEFALVCTYQRCAAEGVVTASCAASGWDVSVAACEPVACGGELCPEGQICFQQFAGAQLMQCADNPCGGDSLDCDCAATLCGDLTCSTSALTVTCTVDCTSGDCPP